MGSGLLQPTHLIFLGLLGLLLFGGKRLPEMARGLGTGLREFKESVGGSEVQNVIQGVQEVQGLMNPVTLAGAVVPGVKDMQESIAATKELVNPLSGLTETAAPETPAAS